MRETHWQELNRKHQDYEQSLKEADFSLANSYSARIQVLESQKLQEQEAHTITRKQYESQLKQIGRQHDNELQERSAYYDRETLCQKRLEEEQLSDIKTAHAAALDLAHKRQQEDLQILHAQIMEVKDKKGSDMWIQKETNVGLADGNLQNEINRVSVEANRLTLMEVEIRTQKAGYEADVARLKEMHKAKQLSYTMSLQQSVEALKEALLQRDHFKAMSDHELAHRFQGISCEVDDLSRLRWETVLEPSWPFPAHSFTESDNQRRAKQYILQNTLWVILYTSIFCTPFRILGKEGTLLEQSWIKKYGAGEFTLVNICEHQLTFARPKFHE